ncbi:MAG: hypothetical protein KGI89_12085 [Euryarchaeota archaeon]|nr:hypothetical protein [Euryarchaeota archaeon]
MVETEDGTEMPDLEARRDRQFTRVETRPSKAGEWRFPTRELVVSLFVERPIAVPVAFLQEWVAANLQRWGEVYPEKGFHVQDGGLQGSVHRYRCTKRRRWNSPRAFEDVLEVEVQRVSVGEWLVEERGFAKGLPLESTRRHVYVVLAGTGSVLRQTLEFCNHHKKLPPGVTAELSVRGRRHLAEESIDRDVALVLEAYRQAQRRSGEPGA